MDVVYYIRRYLSGIGIMSCCKHPRHYPVLDMFSHETGPRSHSGCPGDIFALDQGWHIQRQQRTIPRSVATPSRPGTPDTYQCLRRRSRLNNLLKLQSVGSIKRLQFQSNNQSPCPGPSGRQGIFRISDRSCRHSRRNRFLSKGYKKNLFL